MKKKLMGILTALLILGFAGAGLAADAPSVDIDELTNTTAAEEIAPAKAVKKHKKRSSRKKKTKRLSRKNHKKSTQ